jgi:hypothetical protein
MKGKEARELARLEEAHPGWHLWRTGAMVYARWLESSPPIILSGPTAAEFAERIPKAEAAAAAKQSYWAILRAAGERKR